MKKSLENLHIKCKTQRQRKTRFFADLAKDLPSKIITFKRIKNAEFERSNVIKSSNFFGSLWNEKESLLSVNHTTVGVESGVKEEKVFQTNKN